jgi:hypothetical protein
VTEGKLASNSVTEVKIANNAVTFGKVNTLAYRTSGQGIRSFSTASDSLFVTEKAIRGAIDSIPAPPPADLRVTAGGIGCYMLARSPSNSVSPGQTLAASSLQPIGWFGTSEAQFEPRYRDPFFTGTWQCIHGAAPNGGVEPGWGGLWQRIA